MSRTTAPQVMIRALMPAPFASAISCTGWPSNCPIVVIVMRDFSGCANRTDVAAARQFKRSPFFASNTCTAAGAIEKPTFEPSAKA